MVQQKLLIRATILNNEYIVVVGGEYNGVTIRSVAMLHDLTSEFFLGPDFPNGYGIMGHEMVSTGESIITFGGEISYGGGEGSDMIRDIYQFQCINLECEWSKLEQSLQYSRGYFVAMLIPDDLMDCTENREINEQK